jgi:carboxyl-terminal processing protease
MKLFAPFCSAILLTFAALSPARAETDFNEVGKAMAMLLQDAHYQRVEFDAELNRRILDVYLDELDPERLYLTKRDIAEFEQAYTTLGSTSAFDRTLMQEQGMIPAREIYDRYLERVEELTTFVRKITAAARLDFPEDATAPVTRKGSAWPDGLHEAQQIWYRRIADELLSEELRRESVRELSEKEELPDPFKNQPSPRETLQKKYTRFEQVVKNASDEAVADQFLSAVARAHDPHSEYLSVRENEEFEREMQNQLSGIGAKLQARPDGTTRVSGLFVDGPAQKAGDLKLNDRILKVDPQNTGDFRDITFLPLPAVIDLILGKSGTEVALLVRNPEVPSAERKVVITRGTISIKDASASAEIIQKKLPDGTLQSLGWLKVPSFYLDFTDRDPSVFRDIERLVKRMKEEEVDGIALDLRGNPGGSLEEAPRIAGLFLPPGPVVQARAQNGSVQVMSSPQHTTPLFTGPLVVVTDKESASSSEILAAALQDHNRALVIGESSTFGKGTVQEKISLARYFTSTQDSSRAGDLKTTVQKFYRVTGSSTQLKGVVPDIIVPSLNDALEIGEAYLPYALPHDIISTARDFHPLDRNQLHADTVVAASRQRIKESVDFDHLVEDVSRLRREERFNARPLNRDERIREAKEEEEQLRSRNEERRLRYNIMEEHDKATLSIFRLTLDDLEREELLPVERSRDTAEFMIEAPEDVPLRGNPAPEWPSGIDPLKRESIALLSDLVRAKSPPQDETPNEESVPKKSEAPLDDQTETEEDSAADAEKEPDEPSQKPIPEAATTEQ